MMGIHGGGERQNRKAMASVTLLEFLFLGKCGMSVMIYRVFRNKSAPLNVIFDRVKREARLWL
jgi:hypothetical protein